MGTKSSKCGRTADQNIKNMHIKIDETVDLAERKDTEPKAELGEFLTQKGAMALAKRLEVYWHAKGYLAARFWAEPIGERFEKVGTYEIYRVTSNLVNGIPPRYAAQYQAPVTGSLMAH